VNYVCFVPIYGEEPYRLRSDVLWIMLASFPSMAKRPTDFALMSCKLCLLRSSLWQRGLLASLWCLVNHACFVPIYGGEPYWLRSDVLESTLASIVSLLQSSLTQLPSALQNFLWSKPFFAPLTHSLISKLNVQGSSSKMVRASNLNVHRSSYTLLRFSNWMFESPGASMLHPTLNSHLNEPALLGRFSPTRVKTL
jgi:hypothetical protein